MALKKKENTTTLKKEIGKFSEKGKALLAVTLALSLSALLFLFVYTLLDAVTPESVSEEEYELLLAKLDGREWGISPEDGKTAASYLSGYRIESALTKKSGNTLILILYETEKSHTLYFGYKDGMIKGFISSTLFTLYPSSGLREKNRALTLLGGDEKIVFYSTE